MFFMAQALCLYLEKVKILKFLKLSIRLQSNLEKEQKILKESTSLQLKHHIAEQQKVGTTARSLNTALLEQAR